MKLDDEIKLQLAALMQTKKEREAATVADKLIRHAMGTTPPPGGGGDLFCGWPIKDLLDKVPSHARVDVATELYKKMQSMGALNGGLGSVGGGGASGGGGSGQVTLSPQGGRAGPGSRPHSLTDMVRVRMRWHDDEWAQGFEHIGIHEHGETVQIWIINKDGQSVVLTDEASMFPSDAFITKIRLMQQGV